MLRSCLEKVLNRNGYTKDELEKEDVKPDLYHRIELAAKDGVITAARRKRAHSNVRVLGNDILHEDWKPVEREAYEDSHHYTVRILEDFYDDRETVETLLKGKRRISDDVEPDRA